MSVIAFWRGTDASVSKFGVLDGTRSHAAESTYDRCQHLERGR